MKKKLISLLFIICVSASLFAGCGASGDNAANGDTAAQTGAADTGRDAEPLTGAAADSRDAAFTGGADENNMSEGAEVNIDAPAPADSAADAAEEEMYFEEACEEMPAMDLGFAAAEKSLARNDSASYDDCFIMEPDSGFNTEEYSSVEENSFASVSMTPLSTFAADVDTASYANLRRMIHDGYYPEDIPSGAVRVEEMINYFSYHYNGPKKGEPFGVNAVIGNCPWNEDTKLLMLGLQTEAIDFSEAGDSNIVFLIDVSGSMYDDNKLPLLKQAFGLLIDNLGEKDRVSIVTYASSNDVVLKGVPGCEKDKIMEALNSLEAGGSTNGGEGLITAYELAEEYFIKGGNNRVILATDGDLNVGITSESALHDLITEKKESGVFLSVLGFGMGNDSDTNMETLADAGNGNYAYIDSLPEAKKVLVEELGATMVTVAKDVKLQVEFNPAVVYEYRLIGYENRKMAAEDFADDTKDAGEIGAGHSVTALYELVLADEKQDENTGLRYQSSSLTEKALHSDEWLTLSIRYKEPEEDKSKLLEYPIGTKNYTENPNEDFIFAADVAQFAMLLKDSQFKGDSSYRSIMNSLDELEEMDEYREEFEELVEDMWRRE